MRKLSSINSFVFALLASFITLSFFIPKLVVGKIPSPADSLLGLYHPWRDITFEGFDPGRFPIKNPLVTDPILQGYPWRYLVVKNIKLENFPLWNPYSFSGQPLLANIQSAPLQLLNLIFFLLPFKWAWSAQVIIPSLLTSIFMFLFLRNRFLSPVASTFGALILPFSGFFIAWLTWGTIVATVMWLPLILFCLDKTFAQKNFWYFLLLLLAITQTILSGHWQAAFYVFLASGFYLTGKILNTKNLQATIISILAIFLGILIVSFQILPSLEFIKYSARGIDQGFSATREDWFLPPQHLIQLIAPDFFGNPTTYNYWGIWNYGEFVSFLGIIPLSLALLALIKLPKQSGFFLILALGSLIFTLKSPISQIPYITNVPLLSTMQPSRIIFLLDFSLAALAAIGLDLFLKEKSRLKILLPTIFIGTILLTLFLVSHIQTSLFPKEINIDSQQVAVRNLILPIMIALTFGLITILKILNCPRLILIVVIFSVTIFELFRFGYKFTPFSKFSWHFPQTSTLKFLAQQEKPYRVMSTDRRILHPNTSAVYSLESTDGYDPLYLKSYANIVSTWQSNKVTLTSTSFNRIITPQKYDSKFIDLLNVKYIISFDEINNSNFLKVHQEGATLLYENKNVLPRAFFVNEIINARDDKEELENLIKDNFDISKSATSQEVVYGKSQNNGSAIFTKYTDQSFTIATRGDKLAPLVISNIYYPGWKAAIDGISTKIYKVNYTFQAVIVPDGQHSIEFKYLPDSFVQGFYLSGLGVLLALLLGLYLWRTKSR